MRGRNAMPRAQPAASPGCGAAIVEHGGRIAAHGLARSREVAACLADPEWMAALRGRRLATLATPRGRFLVLLMPLDGADLVVLSEAPGDAVLEFVAAVDFAWDIIEHVVTDPFDAMTVVDARARVAYISPVHEAFFGLDRGGGIGRPVREVIENTRLDRVLATGKPEIGEIQRMRGAERVVSRIPIAREGRVVGAIGRVMFKGPQQVEALARHVNALQREVDFYRREAAALRGGAVGSLDDIVGESAAIRRLKRDIAKVAPLDVPVLIHGESGTGKELVARALHALSPRRGAALVAVNGAALPASLVESELFGYAPGAFTGADRKGRKGRFEQAAGGTILLDEIGEMPPETQAKLLRVLQERTVERVGGEAPLPVDFRLVSATHCDLKRMVAEGRFRLDLFYRISPVVIEVPGLAERREDIPLLARHFLHELAQRHRRSEPELDPAAEALLRQADWPGNVRELRHAVERALIFAEGERLTPAAFADVAAGPARPAPAAEPQGARLADSMAALEAAKIREAMQRNRGNKKRVAAELGISRTYLYKRLAEIDA